MKKTLVALAVLAASGASMAQSTVTLYGIADVEFGSDTVDNGKTSLSQTKVNSGGVNGSRFGLKGSEDLGGGMSVNFDFQQGFSIDSGAARDEKNNQGVANNNNAFSRASWVGIAGTSWGSTRFGRTPTPYDDVQGVADAMYDSNLAPANSVMATAASYTIRPANTLAYYTPNFSGFNASVSYSLGEDKTATTDAGSVTSFQATYAAGPIMAYLAYQTEKLTAPSSTSVATTGTNGLVSVSNLGLPTDSTDFTRLGAWYDLGVAKPMFTYGKASKGSASIDEYQLGVDVPFGATTLSASWATSQDNTGTSANDQKRTGYGLGAKYALSKRTFVYGGYESDTKTQTNVLDIKHTLLAVGMQHRF